jgi:hypothetical protein
MPKSTEEYIRKERLPAEVTGLAGRRYAHGDDHPGVLGGLSCRDFEAAAVAVPDAFGLRGSPLEPESLASGRGV